MLLRIFILSFDLFVTFSHRARFANFSVRENLSTCADMRGFKFYGLLLRNRRYLGIKYSCLTLISIFFIQSEIRELERTREAMARELVTLSEANSEQAEQLEQHETLKKTYQVSEYYGCISGYVGN